MTKKSHSMHSTSNAWVRLRVILRTVSLPLAVAGAAAASFAFLVSGGRPFAALLAGAFGVLSGTLAGFLRLIAPEHRLAVRWPRLSLAGWRPPQNDANALPVELYAAGEVALRHCRAARVVLGVRADTFRLQVVGLVGKGDAAYARALEAERWLEEAQAQVDAGPRRNAQAQAEGDDQLGRWVQKSARARAARKAQVERDLRGARAEHASTTEMLGDLALRMSGLEGELGSDQHERKQILPHLAQLHEEMSALERAVALTPEQGKEVLS